MSKKDTIPRNILPIHQKSSPFSSYQVMDSVSVSGGGSYAGAGGAGHYGTYGHYGTAAYQPQTAYMVETTQVPQYMGQVCTLFVST